MVLPVKALKAEDFIYPEDKASVKDGSHQTFKVKFFEENGVQQEGYYKTLGATYTPFSAKLSVAASELCRLNLGNRAAQERLVFDENNKLVGTLSYTINGFEPFYYKEQGEPESAALRSRVIPSTKTLIEHNVMELYFLKWFLGDDDGHPHNSGLKGILDFDMFFHWIIVFIKGKRPIVNAPVNRPNITAQDYTKFMALIDAQPYHWPTFVSPGQESFPAIVPGQEQLLSKILPKVYSDPTQFQALAGELEAQKQKTIVALKCLLTFQPEVVRRRLTELFGDVTLDYTSLDELDPTIRIALETTFPLLFNATTNSGSLVDFVMKLYQEHYDYLYRVVVFYEGCEDNGHFIELLPTYKALYNNPSYFKEIQEWIEKNNETNFKNEPSLQLEPKELTKRYHQVWRDAYTNNLKDLLHDAYQLTFDVFKKASSETVVPELVSVDVTHVETAWELIGTMPELSKEKMEPYLRLPKDCDLSKALMLLIEFSNKFHSISRAYYVTERKDLTEKDNANFCKELRGLLSDYLADIKKNLYHTGTHADRFSSITDSLERFAKEVNFKVHLASTDDEIKRTVVTTQKILPLAHPEVIGQFNTSLFLWAKGITPTQFNQYIIEIIETKYRSPLGNRWREAPVKEYLASSLLERNDARLAYILASGNEGQGALNTLLIQYLTPRMLETQKIPSISQALNEFNSDKCLPMYTKAAVAHANKQFVHLYNTEGQNLFFKTIYAWIRDLDRDSFNKLINSTLDAYDSKRFYFTTSRRDEVKGYSNTFKNQDRILAFIFANGGKDSTYNGILFDQIILQMKADTNPTNLGLKLMKQYNLKEHRTMFLSLLQSSGSEQSHQQEKAATSAAQPV